MAKGRKQKKHQGKRRGGSRPRSAISAKSVRAIQKRVNGFAAETADTLSGLVRDARASALGAGQSALEFARRHPVPVALGGLGAATGVAWLVAGESREQLAKRAQASMERAANLVADRAQHVARDARARGDLLGELLGGAAERTLRDHPLAASAAVLAVGAALGAALPRTA